MSSRHSFVFIFICTILFLSVEKSWGATPLEDSIELPLYFRIGEDLLLKEFRGVNQKSLMTLDELLNKENRKRISSIHIVGSASPEGKSSRNAILARRRAKTVHTYIRLKYPFISRDSLYYTAVDVLPQWISAVEKDPNVPRKNKALGILRSDASIDTKWANIRLLIGGPAHYMEREIFPELRSVMGCVVVFYPEKGIKKALESDTQKSSQAPEKSSQGEPQKQTTDSSAIVVPLVTTETTPSSSDSPSDVLMSERSKQAVEYISKPILALKTNLLFDLATLLNVEIEVPIGKRFSVAGEWIFPWWLWEKNQNCLQMLSGNLEGKYWFGNRDRREVMTGWFAGLYAGGGYYDLEWNRTGYQGEFFIAAGISAGFAHTIARNLRMEYSLGVGYLQTDYRKYEAKFEPDDQWHLYLREAGRYSWLGPTRAKISLVWLINAKVKKGGVRP